MSLGENIKKIRKQKSLTQKKLAEKIGKKEITIRKYENGDISPSVEIINEIAKALGVPNSYLIRDNSSESGNENIINLIDALLNSLIDFSTSGAGRNSIVNNNCNGEELMIETIINLTKFINIATQLYKNHANEYEKDILRANIDSINTLLAQNDESTQANLNMQLEQNKNLGILYNGGTLYNLEKNIIENLANIKKSYTPKNMYP